jgi:hypothetical protein
MKSIGKKRGALLAMPDPSVGLIVDFPVQPSKNLRAISKGNGF